MRRNICLRRGQVWFIKEDERYTEAIMEDPDNHMYAKSRPYLIISRRETLKTSDIVNIVPLSMAADYDFPSHVVYKEPRSNKMQVICCEHIYTRSKKVFEKNGYYMFDVPDGVMDEVTALISNQIGSDKDIRIHNMEGEIEQLEKLLLDLSKSVVKLGKVVATQKVPGFDTAPEVTKEIVVTLDKVPEEKVVEGEKKEAEVVNTSKSSSLKTSTSKSWGRVNGWTDDEKLQFLIDVEESSQKEVSKKYEMAQSSVSRYVKRFREELHI